MAVSPLRTENERSEMRDGDLVLIDAGCEYKGLRGRHHAYFPREREIYASASA